MAKKKVGQAAPRQKATFEESVAEIRQIVTELESGELSLDRSIGRYEEAINRLRDCRGQLEDAQKRVQVLAGIDEDGQCVLEPLEDLEESSGPRRGAGTSKSKATTRRSRPDQASGKGADSGRSDAGDVEPLDEVDDDVGLF